MSERFFTDLELPRPDVNLNVGSGSHAVQTARIMLEFEPVLERLNPDWVVVYGDVNSTVACALVASKRNIRVAHMEAGLRSFDRSMPEEINRAFAQANLKGGMGRRLAAWLPPWFKPRPTKRFTPWLDSRRSTDSSPGAPQRRVSRSRA